MSTFIARVQLTVNTSKNYTILRDAIIKAGFTKNIKGQHGAIYILPNGNYLIESGKTIDEILTTVKAVINKIGDKGAQVLITEVKKGGNVWLNLPLA